MKRLVLAFLPVVFVAVLFGCLECLPLPYGAIEIHLSGAMSARTVDPSLDMTYFETEKLKLKREEVKPTINMERIQTGLLKVNANRSQNQVNKQIRKNEIRLKYCIHKFTKFTLNKKLTAAFTFEIDYRGHVLRNSIRIVETNIKNDQLLKCLHRVIGSWKNFGEIEDQDHTYTVRQKWIF